MFGIVFSQDTSGFLQIDTVASFYTTIPGHACASITERGVLDYEVLDYVVPATAY
jgi:hypothetical protein